MTQMRNDKGEKKEKLKASSKGNKKAAVGRGMSFHPRLVKYSDREDSEDKDDDDDDDDGDDNDNDGGDDDDDGD